MKLKHQILALSIFAILGVLVYARWVEPNWLEITRHSFPAPIEKNLKIMHLTDLHTFEVGRREKHVLEIMDMEGPDAILVSGDTISKAGDWQNVKTLLSQLHAPLGVFVVSGNWEHWIPSTDELEIYKNSGVTFLNNDSVEISKGLWLVGLDDAMAGSPDKVAAFAKVPSGTFVMALFHSPILFDDIADRTNLALAGHTHGGQVRIPFVPPLWLPFGSGEYVAGWYSRGAARMYVSRGVGNSIAEFRFACRPEIAVIELKPAGHRP